MKLLVIGATGTVGSNVVRELLARGHEVRALTRDAGTAGDRLGAQVEIVRGDLLDRDTHRALYDGIDGAFLLFSVGPTEAFEGLVTVSSAMTAGVKRLVYLSVIHADRAPHLPHFGSKLGIEAAVKASGSAWTILRPSHFYQNDLSLRDAITQFGVYPSPLGSAGVARVDVRDVAELAASALTQPGHASKTYEVISCAPVTGAQMAEAWSAALGRPVRYAGDDLEGWERQASQFMPPWMVYDLKLMYRHFQRHGVRVPAAELAAMHKLLGHPPRKLEDFTTETVAAWAREGAAQRAS